MHSTSRRGSRRFASSRLCMEKGNMIRPMHGLVRGEHRGVCTSLGASFNAAEVSAGGRSTPRAIILKRVMSHLILDHVVMMCRTRCRQYLNMAGTLPPPAPRRQWSSCPIPQNPQAVILEGPGLNPHTIIQGETNHASKKSSEFCRPLRVKTTHTLYSERARSSRLCFSL